MTVWDRPAGAPGTGSAIPGPRATWRRLPAPLRLALAVFGVLLLWYGVIGTWLGGVHVDLARRPDTVLLPPGGSATVAQVARLIQEQVVERAFVPNDPVIFPTGLAQRTRAFQSAGIGTAARAFAVAIGPTPSPALAQAAQALSVPPETGRLRATWPPIGRPAEYHYTRALEWMIADNAARPAVRRTTGLPLPARAAIRLLQADLQADVQAGDRLLRGLEPGSVSVQVARARGTAYAAALVLRGLRDDHALAVRASGKAARWGEALDSLEAAAGLDPLVSRRSDLVTLGYLLLLAGNAMQDIAGDG